MTRRLTKLSRSVAGKVVLITGAGSGMGRATALLFADEGAKVAVTDVQSQAVESVVAEITRAGGTALGVQLDVSEPTSIETGLAMIRDRLGRIGVLVNNAGISVRAEPGDEDFDDRWQLALDVLLTPHQRLIRACLDDLKVGGEGRVINISSTEGLGASRSTTPYTAAKHGVIGLTRAMAIALAQYGITVNAVCPGPILTSMTEAIPAEHRERFARRRTALRRYGDPEEVAHMVLNLALPSSSYVTGAVIAVDGGQTMKND
ncbi:MAG: SDR family oxidoreductase [Acidimicrobiaceae bacterium]|nr:SDR family oxidoreductase [Acidimicrobiaceae bacterium]MXW74661.1 SDR family oxidoreductase [Acidimicrobiaceae bacterium]MYC41366.1 SDR family oxidoreductase [Acidimicrobiaceae bacterium]MYD05367.1 SDR family oxidoreductase [Acidimicrobiaceae bacterium]MYI59825.1 SDR family oxidoreductase [Acidimicrobiaceae bacterium]